jgi:hypothetical protein
MKNKLTHVNQYAIWIDHKKAIIGCIDEKGNFSSEELLSDMEGRERFGGEETSKTGLFGHTLNREKQLQNRRHNLFKSFIKLIVSRLERVNSILVLGPSDARHELCNEIQKRRSFADIWIETKPADKLDIHGLKQAMKTHFKA